jgi:peroxiredoxin
MKFRLPAFRRPRWQRSGAGLWVWTGLAAGVVAILVIGLLTWKLRASNAAQPQQKNPLMLDAPRTPLQALDFTAVGLNGRTIRLSDFRGSVVLLNFWATWCVPCLEEMPALDRLTRTMAGRKFRVLAVDLQETPEKVQDFAKTHRFSFDLVLDAAGEISSHYGVTRIPVTYVLDQRGTIIRRALGPRNWDSEEGIAFFQELLQSPAPAQPVSAPASGQAEPPPLPATAGPAGLAFGGVRK